MKKIIIVLCILVICSVTASADGGIFSDLLKMGGQLAGEAMNIGADMASSALEVTSDLSEALIGSELTDGLGTVLGNNIANSIESVAGENPISDVFRGDNQSQDAFFADGDKLDPEFKYIIDQVLEGLEKYEELSKDDKNVQKYLVLSNYTDAFEAFDNIDEDSLNADEAKYYQKVRKKYTEIIAAEIQSLFDNNSGYQNGVTELSLDIECEKNSLFSKYDVDVYVEKEYVATIRHGKKLRTKIRVPKGRCKITFRSYEKSSVDGYVTIDTSTYRILRCQIHCKRNKIKIDHVEKLK